MLESFKAKKALETILFAPDANSPDVRDAVARLKDLGGGAIPKIIDALQYNHKNDLLENLLATMLDRNSESKFIRALATKDNYILAGVARAMAKAPRLNPNPLIPLLIRSDVSKAAVLFILQNTRARLDPKALLKLVGDIDRENRQAYFRLLEQVVTESVMPEVETFCDNEDPAIRQAGAYLLSKFSLDRTRDVLLRLLDDEHKGVRIQALEGLVRSKVAVSAGPILRLLRDPDMTVQSKAIEALTRINPPDTVTLLIDALQDQSEYVRRAAVEVLNEIGTDAAIKDLIQALKDKDWWVRVRAADALGHLGGPRVMDAIFKLINDEDEFLRRTAVEILNTTKDPRAFDYLVKALQDADWWVRERAADALAALSDKRAVSGLLKMLDQYPESRQIAIRALAGLGDQRAVQPILGNLQNKDVAVRKEALQALAALATGEQADFIRQEVAKLLRVSARDVHDLADEAVMTLVTRLGDETVITAPGAGAADKTSLIDLSPGAADSLSRQASLSLEPGTVLDNRYRLIRRVGEGAFGIVMLVEDQMVKEQIILKFLNPRVASDESVVKRFVHELRYARKITHENVIRIYDFITFNNAYAISMEYFASHSLGVELKKGPFTDRQRALRILQDIITGISVAHRANVVHRDLKPANILIDDDDHVKVVDFGLAAAASSSDSRVTKSGVLVGTPTYMAPEQARGQPIDLRTDIYSLGVIMYEMFTGRPPYTGNDSMAILFKHVEGKPTPPRELKPDIPEVLEKIILKAMAVDRIDRYQSIEALGADLRALLEKEVN